jgi:hypothetical protein
LLTKSLEARYWGIPFAKRFRSLFRGLTQGAEGSDKRQALDNTLVALENRVARMTAMYDIADAPSGLLGKMEGIFFKLTGVSSVIDTQRGDREAMFASHIGGKRASHSRFLVESIARETSSYKKLRSPFPTGW